MTGLGLSPTTQNFVNEYNQPGHKPWVYLESGPVYGDDVFLETVLAGSSR